jgi:hypothetical protein
MGSILFLLMAVAACSSTATPSPTVLASSAEPATPSPIPTPSPTASPTPTPRPSPRPMAPATLTPGPPMKEPLYGGQAVVRLEDGRVLFMGGNIPFTGKCGMACTPWVPTASVEIYDPGTGDFSPNGSLAEPSAGGQALLLHDGRVLLSSDNTIEIYDPAHGTSVPVQPPAGMKLPLDPTVLLLADGRVFMAGDSVEVIETIEIYDPAHGTSVPVLPPAGMKLPYGATVVPLADGRVLLAGGSDEPGYPASMLTVIVDPATGVFSHGPQMVDRRDGATATLLEDGRVLLLGGQYYEGEYLKGNANAELIDPSHPLSPSTLLPLSQYPVSSTLLSDGRVLVMEEFGGGAGAAGSEVFDPRTEKFTPAGPMSTPRTGSTAIRIPDGRVLVFGGVDSQGEAVATVEAFDPDSETFQVIAKVPDIQGFGATLLDDGEILIVGDSGNATWFLKP